MHITHIQKKLFPNPDTALFASNVDFYGVNFNHSRVVEKIGAEKIFYEMSLAGTTKTSLVHALSIVYYSFDQPNGFKSLYF